MRQKKAGLLVLCLWVSALAGQEALAQTPSDQPQDMVFAWTAPSTGTPAVKYEVQVRRGGMRSSDITTTEVTITEITISVAWLTLYEVRVRGIDAQNNRGQWSAWSLAEDRDRGAPGF